MAQANQVTVRRAADLPRVFSGAWQGSDLVGLEATSLTQRRSAALVRWFTRYSWRYVGRHFHTVRVSRSGIDLAGLEGPLVIYLNHASWWDPLVCVLLADRFLGGRRSFAPIDAQALHKYRFFSKLGFFPVEQNSRIGAARFRSVSLALLEDPAHALWLTPQGRFADVRERPIAFRPGLGHLAATVRRAHFVPLAVDYCFWEERKPEILVRCGDPISIVNNGRIQDHPRRWNTLFEEALTQNLEALRTEAVRRDPADFNTVLRRTSGIGGIYDAWRALRSRFAGREFNPSHGAK